MKENAPLGTARSCSQGLVRAATPSPLGGARAWLKAIVCEQIAQGHGRRSRADVAEAIARAERGQESFLGDLDPDDPAHMALYDRSHADVLEERHRRDGVAAGLLAVKRKRGRWPG